MGEHTNLGDPPSDAAKEPHRTSREDRSHWPILTSDPDEPGVVALRRERERARELGAAEIDKLPSGPITLARYLALCKDVEHRVSPTVSYSGVDLEVFCYYATEMLPRILPNVQRSQLRVNYEDSPATVSFHNNETVAQLPEQIDGVPIDDIVGLIGAEHDVLSKKKDTIDRIELVDGLCGFVTKDCMISLRDTFPQLDLTNIRIETASRRTFAGESGYPRLKLLSDGHSVFTIDYRDESNTAMALVIDPTIAQVDMSNEYDFEVTAVPARDLDTFLRLRYRTYPDKPVIKYHPMSKR